MFKGSRGVGPRLRLRSAGAGLLAQYRGAGEIRLCCFVVYGVLRVPTTSRLDENSAGLDSICAFGRKTPAASGVESPRWRPPEPPQAKSLQSERRNRRTVVSGGAR